MRQQKHQRQRKPENKQKRRKKQKQQNQRKQQQQQKQQKQQNQRKRLEELTISDNFMFGAVMIDEELCKGLLELTLEFPIEKVTVSKEKSIVYHPEYKGVRLDIIAKDENHTHYNVEMQVKRKPEIGKRSRYYHSQIDMELLLAGKGYEELPDAYVIFICDFDPFYRKRYRYTFKMLCEEDSGVELEDGSRTVFLSTHGENEEEVPESLVKFLKYVKADLAGSMEDFEDDFVRRIQESVKSVKASREMEAQYMLMEEWIQDERKEAKAEGIAVGKAEGIAEGIARSVIKFLEKFGEVQDDLFDMIMEEEDQEVLESYIMKASMANSIDEFISMVQEQE